MRDIALARDGRGGSFRRATWRSPPLTRASPAWSRCGASPRHRGRRRPSTNAWRLLWHDGRGARVRARVRAEQARQPSDPWSRSRRATSISATARAACTTTVSIDNLRHVQALARIRGQRPAPPWTTTSAVARQKQPLEMASAGSTFHKRPEGYFAGKLINVRGPARRVCGRCAGERETLRVRGQHGPRERERTYSGLIEHVQAEVKSRFGVDLEPEVRMIGEFSRPMSQWGSQLPAIPPILSFSTISLVPPHLRREVRELLPAGGLDGPAVLQG